MIGKETVVCISVAEKPGNFGATVFNTAFDELDMDFIYKPFLVHAKDLEGAIQGVRALGMRGCGVSMPHKMTVMQYLDTIDPSAKSIGAVNTIVNDAGKLTGYNTDFEGAKTMMTFDYSVSGKRVVVVGAGGAARALIQAAKESGAKDIVVTNRDENRGEEVAQMFCVRFSPWDERENFSGDLLVNATPVGMRPDDNPIFSKEMIGRFEALFDVVVSAQDTRIIEMARDIKMTTLPGIRMAALQGMAQFKLYTGRDISESIMKKSTERFFSSR